MEKPTLVLVSILTVLATESVYFWFGTFLLPALYLSSSTRHPHEGVRTVRTFESSFFCCTHNICRAFLALRSGDTL